MNSGTAASFPKIPLYPAPRISRALHIPRLVYPASRISCALYPTPRIFCTSPFPISRILLSRPFTLQIVTLPLVSCGFARRLNRRPFTALQPLIAFRITDIERETNRRKFPSVRFSFLRRIPFCYFTSMSRRRNPARALLCIPHWLSLCSASSSAAASG